MKFLQWKIEIVFDDKLGFVPSSPSTRWAPGRHQFGPLQKGHLLTFTLEVEGLRMGCRKICKIHPRWRKIPKFVHLHSAPEGPTKTNQNAKKLQIEPSCWINSEHKKTCLKLHFKKKVLMHFFQK